MAPDNFQNAFEGALQNTVVYVCDRIDWKTSCVKLSSHINQFGGQTILKEQYSKSNIAAGRASWGTAAAAAATFVLDS